MKGKIVWLVVSCLMVVALVLASCGKAVTEEEKEVVTPTEEEVVTPTEEEVVTPTEEEVVTPTEEAPKYGGWLTMGRSEVFLGMDPAYASYMNCQSMSLTNEQMTTADWAKGAAGTGEYDFALIGCPYFPNPVGTVLESWEFPDPDTIILHVKKGEDAVHYAVNPDSEASRLVGGRAVTAEDIAFSITREFTSPASWGYRSYYNWWYPGGSATAIDDYTVVVKGHDNPGCTVSTWEPISQGIFVLPPEVIEKYGNMQNWRNSVGTGSFMLTDYISGSYATFVRNPNYWQKDPCGPGKGNQIPYIDGVNWLIILDVSTRIAGLRTGKLDLTGTGCEATLEDFNSLIREHPELQYKRVLGITQAVFFRVDESPFNDVKVRRALCMAVDRQAIKNQYYSGDAELLGWPSPPIAGFMDAYTPVEELPESTKELFEYNPEKAKQFLDEAGYPGPNRLTFSCLTRPEIEYVDIITIFKNDWAKIGVTLNIDVRDRAVYDSVQKARTFHGASLGGTNLVITPFKPSEIITGGAKNFWGFSDPYVDDLYNKIWSWENIGKEDVRQALKKEMSLYVLDLAIGVPYATPYVYRLWWPWVKNYHGEKGIGNFMISNFVKFIWLDQDLRKEMTGK